MTRELDDIDRKILSDLVADARKPFLEIARECGVSGAAIHQRVRKLEENGVICGSRLLVRPSALGLGVCAFISISITEASKYTPVVESLKKIPEVVECHFVTGEYALLTKLYCRDNNHLISVLKTIQKVQYIRSTETVISLEATFTRQVVVSP